MSGPQGGRPCLLDELAAKRIVNAIEKGAPRRHAARAAGVSISALSSWLRRGRAGEEPFAKFAEHVERAESRTVVEVIDRIRQLGEKGEWRALAWILEKRHPREFGDQDDALRAKLREGIQAISDEELDVEIDRRLAERASKTKAS